MSTKLLHNVLTGESIIVYEKTLDEASAIVPSTSDLKPFIISEVTEDVTISNYNEEDPNFYSFTTGTNDLICKIYGSFPIYGSNMTDMRFRIQKFDDSVGTVTVKNYLDETICVLRYQDEWVDIMYTSATTYKKM